MSTPFPLGRTLEHDERSRRFVAPMAATIRSVKHRRYGPILDQQDIGACTGFALAGALNTRPLHRPGRNLRAAEAFGLYSWGTRLDQYQGEWLYDPATGTGTGEDTGSSGLGICKAGVQLGYLKEYRHAFGPEQLKAALMLQPVIVGTVWRTSMFYPDANGFITDSGADEGGHEYEVLGYDLTHDFYWAANSWTALWGVRGFFKIPGPVMARLLDADGDVTVPVSV